MWHLKRCHKLQPLILSVKTALQLGWICVSQVSPSAWGHPKPRLQCHSVIQAVMARYLEAVAVATGWEPPTQVMPHGAASSPLLTMPQQAQACPSWQAPLFCC